MVFYFFYFFFGGVKFLGVGKGRHNLVEVSIHVFTYSLGVQREIIQWS